MQSEEGSDLMCPEHQEKIISVQSSSKGDCKIYCIKCLTKEQVPIESLLQQLKDERKNKANGLIEEYNQSEIYLGQLKKLLIQTQDEFNKSINAFIQQIDDQINDNKKDFLQKKEQLSQPIKQIKLTLINQHFKDLQKQFSYQTKYRFQGLELTEKMIQQYQFLKESFFSKINQLIINDENAADGKFDTIQNMQSNKQTIQDKNNRNLNSNAFLKDLRKLKLSITNQKLFQISTYKQKFSKALANAQKTSIEFVYFLVAVHNECPNCGVLNLIIDENQTMTCKDCKEKFCFQCKNNKKNHNRLQCFPTRFMFRVLLILLVLNLFYTLGIFNLLIKLFYLLWWLIQSFYNFEWLNYLTNPSKYVTNFILAAFFIWIMMGIMHQFSLRDRLLYNKFALVVIVLAAFSYNVFLLCVISSLYLLTHWMYVRGVDAPMRQPHSQAYLEAIAQTNIYCEWFAMTVTGTIFVYTMSTIQQSIS